MREGNASPGIVWVVGLALVVVAALLGTATMAQASTHTGENDQSQYGLSGESEGPVAGVECRAAGNQNGVFDAGDNIKYAGKFAVTPGASATIDDTDGTTGKFKDGKNAKLSSDGSGITVVVTADPIAVSGGDGVLDDTVCDSIVASTGITALPTTGGPLLVVLGALAALGTGLALLRHRAAGR